MWCVAGGEAGGGQHRQHPGEHEGGGPRRRVPAGLHCPLLPPQLGRLQGREAGDEQRAGGRREQTSEERACPADRAADTSPATGHRHTRVHRPQHRQGEQLRHGR